MVKYVEYIYGLKLFTFKIPVLSEMSAMWFLSRVLSGDIKVCIGEIVYTELSSAALGEHDLFAERSRGEGWISTLVFPPMYS